VSSVKLGLHTHSLTHSATQLTHTLSLAAFPACALCTRPALHCPCARPEQLTLTPSLAHSLTRSLDVAVAAAALPRPLPHPLPRTTARHQHVRVGAAGRRLGGRGGGRQRGLGGGTQRARRASGGGRAGQRRGGQRPRTRTRLLPHSLTRVRVWVLVGAGGW
jgi:hypothetical protein